MATASWNAVEEPLISIEQYLQTSYRPDRDFVDGVVEQRNLGEYEHSRLQMKLSGLFLNHESVWGIISLPECRLQVAEQRFRVPDVMVLLQSQKVSRIVREAPLLCIEILSPEDTWERMRARLNDYLTMGVQHLWCFDPDAREVRRYTSSGFVTVDEAELTIPGTAIRIVLTEVFAVLDHSRN